MFQLKPASGHEQVDVGNPHCFEHSEDRSYALQQLESLRSNKGKAESRNTVSPPVIVTDARTSRHEDYERKTAGNISQRFLKDDKFTGNLGKTFTSLLATMKKLSLTKISLHSKSSGIFISFLTEKQNAITVSMCTQILLHMKYVNKLWQKSTTISADIFASVKSYKGLLYVVP